MKPKEIKAELIKKGISQRQIAMLAGCEPNQVSMCINGDGLYQKVREEIAGALGLPIDQIFNTDHPQPKRIVSPVDDTRAKAA